MPTVAVNRDDLFARLGRTYTQDEFEELCFEFGVELDDVLTEAEASVMRGLSGEAAGGGAVSGGATVLYYIAIPANRTDLLCIEGIARALNVFLGKIPPPEYRIDNGGAPGGVPLQMSVLPSTRAIRPYVVCAVLRGIAFTPSRYKSFIDLQDKLHANIARRRTLVAIGTHDLDTLQPPFTYAALPPAEIEFVPLGQARPFRADALLAFYATDASVKHIKPYVSILAGAPAFPVITDARGTVLSLPPIINGEHSKIGLATRNVLVECTATDLTKAHVVLNTVVAMFSEYAAAPFVIEQVQITYASATDGSSAAAAAPRSELTPDLSPRPAHARLSAIASMLGASGRGLTAEEAARLATRMGLPAAPAGVPASDTAEAAAAAAAGASVPGIAVQVPVTRADVLHECDVVEDVAIAFGYNKIARSVPATPCPGAQQPVNRLSDALRLELAAAGYDEVLTLALVSRAENYDLLGYAADAGSAASAAAAAAAGASAGASDCVVLANPKSEDFQVGRTRLVPGLLKALAANRSAAAFASAAGARLFEVSDVLLRDARADVGARNERRLAALYSSPSAGFEVIHGLVDRLMQLLEVPVRPYKWEAAAAPAAGAGAGGGTAAEAAAGPYGRGGMRYYIEADAETPTYFPGRGARVVLESRPEAAGAAPRRVVLGTFGVLAPAVLKAFDLSYPASVVELNIEPFLAQTEAAPAADAAH